jgi:hypothetical protein
MKAEHLISLLDPLFHTLSGGECRLSNHRAMRYICLFCTWPMKFEKSAKNWLVNDAEWLKETK